MKLLIDIVHPAHVHFYRPLINELEEQGAEVAVVSRTKDVTNDLHRGLRQMSWVMSEAE